MYNITLILGLGTSQLEVVWVRDYIKPKATCSRNPTAYIRLVRTTWNGPSFRHVVDT